MKYEVTPATESFLHPTGAELVADALIYIARPPEEDAWQTKSASGGMGVLMTHPPHDRAIENGGPPWSRYSFLLFTPTG